MDITEKKLITPASNATPPAHSASDPLLISAIVANQIILPLLIPITISHLELLTVFNSARMVSLLLMPAMNASIVTLTAPPAQAHLQPVSPAPT